MDRARPLLAVLVAAAAIAALPLPVRAQEPAGPLSVSHPVLVASVQRLTTESASWRQALGAVAATGRTAVVITPDQINTPIAASTLAQVFPLSDEHARVDTVLVVINVDLLSKLSGLSVTAMDFEDDVDRIVAHEIYGHAIPFLLAGTLAGKCADPVAGQSPAASCVIQRENVIRREMRLGERVDYTRESLALARRSGQ
jgi:hypothetical protein